MNKKSFSFKGLNLSYIDTESSKPCILFTHANGFSAGCYSYYIRRLSENYRVLALDFSGHGDSDNTFNFSDWSFFKDQILELIRVESLQNLIGIGHSLGAATLLMSAYTKPDVFHKLILFDPTVLNLRLTILSRIFPNPYAKNALKRRTHFKNLELIKRAFKNHPNFKKWHTEVFEDYLQSCFKKVQDEYVICCDPKLESKIFKVHTLFGQFQFEKVAIEKHVILPEHYEVCTPGRGKKLLRNDAKSSLIVKENGSHFFPMEEPDWTLSKIYECF
jgi:pimeloyl-ACP methyl ester carboxylesterase